MDLSSLSLDALAAAVLGAPSLLLFFEVVLAKSRVGGSQVDGHEAPPNYRVLIPAHDEEGGIEACLRALIPHLPSPQAALVVADNCSDETASIAAALGVEVLTRDDSEHRGKGYALKYGLEHLALDPPECVVFLDADCAYSRGGPRQLAALAIQSGRPTQGLFLMEAEGQSPLGVRAAAFAVRLKNELRVRGLSRISGTVSLQGSSFALPWPACTAVPPPVDELAEDAVWGWRLADRGWPPLFSEETRCEGRLAVGEDATRIQRARWERGTLLGAWRVLPLVLLRSLFRGRLSVSVLALDGLVPPLSILALACSLLALFGGLMNGFQAVSLAPLSLLLSAVFIAWFRVGRDLIAARELSALLGHALVRIVRLPSTVFSGNEWRRTPREQVTEE